MKSKLFFSFYLDRHETRDSVFLFTFGANFIHDASHLPNESETSFSAAKVTTFLPTGVPEARLRKRSGEGRSGGDDGGREGGGKTYDCMRGRSC